MNCSGGGTTCGSVGRAPSRRAPRFEAFFVRNRGRLAWVHMAMAVGFVALIVGPVLLPRGLPAPWNRLPEFASWLIWGLWFPLVFLSVIFTGRSWCGVLCPMGAASEWANKVGLRRTIPRWVRWPGTPIVSFIVVTVLGQTVGVRDYPDAMLEIFGGTLLAAIALGFFFGTGASKRAWCRHMCPIGLLLGMFSRLGAVDFVPKAPRGEGDRYTEKGICPTLIDINHKRESRHCIECFRCVQPQGRGGLALELRKPGAEIERIRHHGARASEIWFLFLGTGVALGAFLWLVLPEYQWLRQAVGEWAINHGWYWIGEPGPSLLMSVHPAQREVFVWLDFILIVAFSLGVMLLLSALLAAATALSAWLSGLVGGDLDFRRRFVELGYQFAPVAMLSLLLGLGGEGFEGLAAIGIPPGVIAGIKVIAFAGGIAWSLYLAAKILKGQGVAGVRAIPVLIPGVLGCLAVAGGWWPAIFG